VGSPSCTDDSVCGAGSHCANFCCTPGKSGSCAKDADCSALPQTPVCDTGSGSCVACLNPRDCGAGKICQNKTCVALPGCSASTDCTPPTPVCDVSHHACVECLDSTDCHNLNAPNCDATHHCTATQQCRADTDCAKPTPKCQLPGGHCVACLANTDCVDPLVCDPVQNICVQPAATGCASDKDCASNLSAPHCLPGSGGKPGVCVACVDSTQCSPGQMCSATNTCVVKQCGADTDCAAATPRCDLVASPHACVACLADKDCPNSGTCQPDHSCKAPAPGCSADADCAQNVSAPYCKVDTRTCVACLTAANCGAGKTCTASNTCANITCASDADCAALKATPHCNTATHSCVQCTAAAQCGNGYRCASGSCAPICTVATQAQDCPPATPLCLVTPYPACVQCIQSKDCPSGQVCSSANTCIAQTGCTSNAGCPPTTPVCSGGSCVQCAADIDCKNGMGCDATAHTCTLSGGAGQICKPGGVCGAGLLCINEGGLNGPVCRPRCDPYASACASGSVCFWLDFDSSGVFEGYCSAPNSHGQLGAACDPTKGNSCEWNLICAPTSATAGVCRTMCDPNASGNCGTSVCNAVTGAQSRAGALLKFGYCGPTSKWGQPCVTDTASAGPDCGAPLSGAGTGASLYCAPSYLPAEVPAASVVALCSYTPAAATAIGGAGSSCAQLTDNACRTGVCLTDGPVTCFSGCKYTTDCGRDGGASSVYCFDVNFVTSTKSNPVATCEPTCRNDADCAALGGTLGRACDPSPTHIGSSWRAVCAPVAGIGKAGAKCTGGSDCASGTCVTGATLQGIELSQSVAGFVAKDGFCFGSASSAADCGVPGTSFNIGAALPLRPLDTGNLGVMGMPHPGVCWGQSCARDRDCAGFSADEANTPRVCAPYKTTTYSSIDNAISCTSDLQCTDVCNSTTNNPNPGGVYGTNAGIYGPNGKCRHISWALECAPSLGGSKLGPGAACTRSSDCRTGHCLTPGNYCFGGCSTDADCLNGTHCKQSTYLGMTTFFCQP
jgi:Cys-rich repeat protein